MNSTSNSIAAEQTGLPGLKPIRKALGLEAKSVAGMAGIGARWIGKLEAGDGDCAQKVLLRISAALCCTPTDLLEMPSDLRLKEIAAAYQQRQADLAAAELAAAKGVA